MKKEYKQVSEKVNLRVRLFREGAIMPSRGSEFAAGFDLYAWTPEHPVSIPAGTMQPIKTGINLRIPAGYEVQIRPRSGLAFKHQITVQNTPGTIDADYDGDGEKFEIVVMLRNEGNQQFQVNHGDRIAQMVLNKLPEVFLVEDFEDNAQRNESTRAGGLGSTGVS
jgi:dUTP pyrophosphatase